MAALQFRGIITDVINNKDGLYEGNLRHYYRVLYKARNKDAPYHNIRHMLHITMLCASACAYYAEKGTPFSKREARNLLVAAMFHDYDHMGRTGNDDLNIELAIRGFMRHALPEDTSHGRAIADMIRGTQFPYIVPADELTPTGQVLRDADVSQAFSVAWIQQVVFGLAAEMNKTPLEILQMQETFLRSIVFHTEWARFMFKDEGQIEEKIVEAKEHLEILEEKD